MADEKLVGRILEFVRKKPDYADVLQNILEYELSNPKDEFGFVWSDIVGGNPARLNRLVTMGLLRITYKTRNSTHYKLVDRDATRGALRQFEAGEGAVTEAGKLELPEDLFSIIVGYDDIQDIFNRSFNARKPVNVLMWGGPSSAKSLFLLELGRIPGATYALGSSSTKAGLADLLLEHRPPVLLLDEIDKLSSMRDYAVLLSLMETGIVSETKYHRRRGERLRTWVVGAANRIDNLPPELKSRFMLLHFREYDEPTYRGIVERVLVEREGCDGELAKHIAEVAVKQLRTRDVREAVRLGRICKSKKEVDKTVEIIRRYKG